MSIENENGNFAKPMLAEVISREQYLNALELIDNYHRQNLTVVSKPIFKSMFNLKKGDFVQCKRIHQQSTNTITLGKNYEVVEVSEPNSYREFFYIIDDKGNRRSYYCKNSQFSAV
jgi:hypothetical protein